MPGDVHGVTGDTAYAIVGGGAGLGRGWSGHGRNKGDDGEAEAMPTPPSTLFRTKIMRTCATPHSQVKWIKQTATGRYRFG